MSRHTMSSRPQIPSLRRFPRGRKPIRPAFEWLEDRTMLDATVPIVVGRVLSSYFTGGVQNNRETITYSVYNNQAAPETGVLLTTTLSSGVTLASASAPADQSGQNLAWSLGTLGGFDRASVSITVNLASPTPAELDSGAQAFAMLDGGSVSASTPAAALRPGNVSDPTLLASTPDANTTDPFVQEEAAALDYDPQKIFDFLHTQVGYNSYVGSVRGARGTLWSMAGNALDVASLGVALMRASGIPAQYEQGTLSQAQAQPLIVSMFPPTFQIVGLTPAGTQTADPANDSQLLAETESHYWFQFDAGSGMEDADPLMQGATLGQSFTASTGSFSEVTDNLREKTEIQLSAEFLSELDEFVGSGLSTQAVLDQTFNDVDLVGHPLTIGNLVGTDVEGLAGINQETYTYTPYIAVGDAAFPDPSHDTTITGTPYQEVYTNFELGSQELTGLFMNVTLSGPQGPAQTYQHTILDRIGFAARQDPGGLNLSVPASSPPAFTDVDLTSLNVLPGVQSPNSTQPEVDYLTALQAQLNQQSGGSVDVAADTGQSASALTDFGIGFTRLLNEQVAVRSDVLSAEMATADSVAAYFDRPRVIVASQSVTQDPVTQTGTISTAIDLLADQIRAIPAPGQAPYAGYIFNLNRGYSENAVESQVGAAAGSGSAGMSAGQVLIAARQQGIPIADLSGPDAIAQLDSFGLDPDTTARIAAALNAGQIVVVPAAPVTINGQQTTGWFQTDPTTGFTTGVLPSGAHGDLLEVVVASAIEGLLLGIAAGVSAATYRIYVVRSFLPGIENPTPQQIQAAKMAADQVDPSPVGNTSSAVVDGGTAAGVGGSLLAALLAVIAQIKNLDARFTAQLIIKKVLTNPDLLDPFEALVSFNLGGARKLLLSALADLGAPGVAVGAAPFVSAATSFLAFAIGNELAFHAFTYLFLNDPPVGPMLSAVATPLHFSPNNARTTAAGAASVVAGQASGDAKVPSVAAAGSLTAAWNSTSTSAVQLTSLSATDAVIVDANGTSVGSGTVGLSASAPVPASVSGSDAYSVTGAGNLSFYGPAESSLGVSGNWTSYSATVTGGAVAITLTTAGLALNGQSLPAGTYTITTASAALAGSGPTTSPNFAGSASLNATGGTVTLGPENGGITLGGRPLDLSSGATLDGYTGSLTVTPNGNGEDTVALNGNAANVLAVSATPAILTTDQNTPVTFQAHVNTSFADTYNLTAQAPPGWTVAIDSSGKVTATPAPGLQAGTFPIQVIARSTTNPDLIAQTTVNISVTPTQPGVTLTAQPDPLLTVPFNSAELPTAFQAIVHNSGPAADTFNLAISNLPAGFTLEQSASSVTIPAGQTGVVGLYLVPTGSQLPAAGTAASFTVTATSTSNPSITKSVNESFTVPAIDALTISASPAQIVAAPGQAATATLSITNSGNVSESVTLTTSGATGLTVGGLAPITVAAGQTATESITLAVDASAALNSTLSATITAAFGPSTSPQTAKTAINLDVVSPQVVALAEATATAGQISTGGQLAQNLNDLQTDVVQLQATPTDPTAQAQLQFGLNNLEELLLADPALTTLTLSLNPILALVNAGGDANYAQALNDLPSFFTSLNQALAVEAAEQFTLGITPNLVDLPPGQSQTLQVQLTNLGSDAETINLGTTGLPTGLTAQLGQAQVTLAAGASTTVPLTLTQTADLHGVFNLAVTATTLAGTQTAPFSVGIRAATADVLGMTVAPQTINLGDPVTVTAQIFNTANVSRTVLAQMQILDASGNLLSTLPTVPVNLVPGSGNITADLGAVATTGLAAGVYELKVSLLASDGSPLPGKSSQTAFGVGQTVTASVAASPAIVPPGTSTVSTIITVNNPSAAGITTYSLAGDWSDANNPNGPWSYNYDINKPITVHQSDWNPPAGPHVPQPAWAFGSLNTAEGGALGQIPGWFLDVQPAGTDINFSDVPPGHVYVHSDDQFNGIDAASNGGNGVANVTWTSPIDGTITVTGDTWQTSHSLGRSNNWSLVFNGTVLTQGTVSDSDSFTSAHPDPFGIFTLTVHKGDVVMFEAVRANPGGPGEIQGVDLNITASTAAAASNSGPAPTEGLTLTPAGKAAGFALTDFAHGFPEENIFGGIGPTGIAFPDALGGTKVLVSDQLGNIRLFTTDTDGQDASQAQLLNTLPGIVGIAQLNGRLYATEQNPDQVVRLNPDGSVAQVIASVPVVTGIAADPANGQLYVTGGRFGGHTGTVFDVDPVAGTATTVVTNLNNVDGITVSPDGHTVYVAVTFDQQIEGFDIQTGQQVFDSGNIPSLDGIAVGSGSLAGFLFANGNNGDFWAVSLANPASPILIASGGTRGDFVTPDPNNGSLLVTQSGELARLIPPAGGGFNGATVTVTDNLPASGYAVDPTSITPAPAATSAAVVEWTAQASAVSSQFALSGTVANMAPGEVRTISLGSSVAVTSTTSDGQQITTTVDLPPVTVAAQHIIAIAPASQDGDKGATLTYTITLTNPLATNETYTLSTSGLDGFAPNLATTVPVPAGQSVTTPLTVTVPVSQPAGSLAFTLDAQTLEGGTDSAEGQLTVNPTVALPTEAVSVKVAPAQATAGPGTPVTYRVTVVNTGNVATTYALGGSFPAGFTARFSTPTVAVAPGLHSPQTVLLTITPPANATAGNVPFSVTATSSDTSTVTASAGATVNVVNFGVSAGLSPATAAPGGTLTMTVTNLGSVVDTYNLTLAGPAGAASTLGKNQVTLNPGASQTIPVTVGALSFAASGPVDLTAIATSQGNSNIRAAASANITVPGSHGLSAQLTPSTQILPIPGTTSFLLVVKNTGTSSDTYTALITGTTGPVQASLAGLDGSPTQAIPLFALPGLTSGAIVINTDLTMFGQGTVSVQVKSLSNASMTDSATATVTAQQAATTLRLSATPRLATFGQPVTFTAVVTPTSGQTLPTGNVVFTIDGVPQPAIPLKVINGKATALLTTSALTARTHTIAASYTNSTFGSSGPVSIAETVNRATSSTRLSASPTTVNAGQSITLAATIIGDGPINPAGSVIFKDGNTVLATVRIGSLTAGSLHIAQSGRTATVSISVKLAAGHHVLSAAYSGDDDYRPSAGAATAQVNAVTTGGDGPRVVGVSRFGIHEQPTTLVLTFDEALAATAASNTDNYTIITVGGPGRGGNLHGRVIPVASVSYEPGSNTIVLHPAQRLDVHNTYDLIVNGTAPGGLTDTSGRLLDGADRGTPGSNFVTAITYSTLVRTPLVTAVDALAAANELDTARAQSKPGSSR